MGRDERLKLAHDVSETLLAHHPAEVAATGLHGSVARGEDADHSDLDFLVVTRDAPTIPSRTLLVGPTVVSLSVFSLADALTDAATIGPCWPLRADQWANVRALHDPEKLFNEIRRSHDQAIESATQDVFDRAAARNLAEATSLAYRARAHLGRDDPAATVEMAEAAMRCVLTIGLLARFTFKNLAHALRVAPDVPGAPPAFAEPFKAAFRRGADPADSMTLLEDAIESLLHEGMRRNLPFAVESVTELL